MVSRFGMTSESPSLQFLTFVAGDIPVTRGTGALDAYGLYTGTAVPAGLETRVWLFTKSELQRGVFEDLFAVLRDVLFAKLQLPWPAGPL